jgi:hypothetical protein
MLKRYESKQQIELRNRVERIIADAIAADRNQRVNIIGFKYPGKTTARFRALAGVETSGIFVVYPNVEAYWQQHP